MDYLVSCNHLVKIVKVYMLPFCGEIKMNKSDSPIYSCLVHVSTKFEIFTASLFRENRRHDRTDGQTDGRRAMLSASY